MESALLFATADAVLLALNGSSEEQAREAGRVAAAPTEDQLARARANREAALDRKAARAARDAELAAAEALEAAEEEAAAALWATAAAEEEEEGAAA